MNSVAEFPKKDTMCAFFACHNIAISEVEICRTGTQMHCLRGRWTLSGHGMSKSVRNQVVIMLMHLTLLPLLRRTGGIATLAFANQHMDQHNASLMTDVHDHHNLAAC